jgi:hypothetical protein
MSGAQEGVSTAELEEILAGLEAGDVRAFDVHALRRALTEQRAEGAAAEREAVLAELQRDKQRADLKTKDIEAYVVDLIDDISKGRHVRLAEGT